MELDSGIQVVVEARVSGSLAEVLMVVAFLVFVLLRGNVLDLLGRRTRVPGCRSGPRLYSSISRYPKIL